MKKNLLVTCYFKNNYGSSLQAFATQKFLDNNNYINLTINTDKLIDFNLGKKKYYKQQLFNINFYKSKIGMIKFLLIKKISNKKLKNKLKLREDKFNEYKKKKFNLTEPAQTYMELNELSKKFDNIIVGSDQLWLPVNVVADYYTLNFVPDTINKISYSTSFGISDIPKKYIELYQRFLKRINYLSVRESNGVEIVEKLINRTAKLVCDPTLLLTREDWEKECSENYVIKEKYIFCYFLGKNKKHRKFAEKIRENTGNKIVSINHCDEYVKYSDKYCDYAPYDVGPNEWLNLIRNAEYVCTDSFHGTIFSLLFNKNFFSFKRHSTSSKYSTNSRIESILTKLELNGRLICGDENFDELKANQIDFNKVNFLLEKLRSESREFFIQSVEQKGEKND